MVKKIALAMTALPFIAMAGTNDPSMDLLIQKLIEKNIINAEEAVALTQDMSKMVDERNKALTGDLAKKVSDVKIKSKAKTIEFNGVHYFGLTSNNYDTKNANNGDKSSGFEMRRNYLQLKGYLTDKDYFRVTLDAIKELESDPTKNGQSTGYSTAFIKYAYLWLDNILPLNTGVEIGIVHRPWIDYEEHNGWFYRSINKVALEDKFSTAYYNKSGTATSITVGPDILNSADLGINFKSQSPFFSSEIGIMNGEGYHADKTAANQQNSSGLSLEWRLTGHIFGNGEKVGKYDLRKESYANISFAGIRSKNHKDNSLVADDSAEFDRKGYWLHAVYNHPMFLIAGQISKTKDDLNQAGTTASSYNKEYKVSSVNTEIRPLKDWTILGRFDKLETEYANANSATTDAQTKYNDKNVGDATQYILGVAYNFNKYVTFIANYKKVNAKDTTASASLNGSPATTVGDILDKKTYMLTTEVKW